jgi:hypothetical protein
MAFLQIENTELFLILNDLQEEMVISAINYLKCYKIISKLSCFIDFKVFEPMYFLKQKAHKKIKSFIEFIHKEKIKSNVLIKNQQFYKFKDEKVDFKIYVQEFEDLYPKSEKSNTIITIYS